jgi:signal recognition particle GTPase
MGNNPDFLLELQERDNVAEYLKEKVSSVKDQINYLTKIKSPDYVIEELCMRILTKDLRPSKFNYISSILQEDFEATYQQLQNSGTLRYEVINLIAACKPAFKSFGFTEENEDDRQLRYAVTGCINEYFTKNQ